MEKVFVDTSALYALISTEDHNKAIAVNVWEEMLLGGETLVTNNYVLVESFVLVQSRLGIEFTRALQLNVIPFIQIEWIDPARHFDSVQRVFDANRRQLSLVDCSSFETMLGLKINKVFTFDSHFREQGFDVIP